MRGLLVDPDRISLSTHCAPSTRRPRKGVREGFAMADQPSLDIEKYLDTTESLLVMMRREADCCFSPIEKRSAKAFRDEHALNQGYFERALSRYESYARNTLIEDDSEREEFYTLL